MMRRVFFREKRSFSRRGAALILALGTVAVIAMLTTALMKGTFAERQQSRRMGYQVQSAWLAESALERAVYRLRADRSYTGETWQIPADEIGGPHDGLVLIQVRAVAKNPSRRQVLVRADYPRQEPLRVRTRKDIIARLPSSEEASP